MIYEIEVKHKQGCQFTASIRQHQITTDIPASLGGTDQAPTPLEMFIASLGACAGFYATVYCKKNSIPYEGLKLKLVATRQDKPVRLRDITIKISLPSQISDQQKKELLEHVSNCPVHNTIKSNPQIKIELE